MRVAAAAGRCKKRASPRQRTGTPSSAGLDQGRLSEEIEDPAAFLVERVAGRQPRRRRTAGVSRHRRSSVGGLGGRGAGGGVARPTSAAGGPGLAGTAG